MITNKSWLRGCPHAILHQGRLLCTGKGPTGPCDIVDCPRLGESRVLAGVLELELPGILGELAILQQLYQVKEITVEAALLLGLQQIMLEAEVVELFLLE